MSYDSKCYELAEHFLQDSPHINTEATRHRFAQYIQTGVEDWLSTEESDYAEAKAGTSQAKPE